MLALSVVVGRMSCSPLQVVPLNPLPVMAVVGVMGFFLYQLWALFSVDAEPIRLAIVRRYQDANGSYVGELYLYEKVSRKPDAIEGFVMIGASLDTMPFGAMSEKGHRWTLDTRNDFLAPIVSGVLRVGSFTPQENETVKQKIARLPRRRMLLTIQNRFVEDVKAVQEKR